MKNELLIYPYVSVGDIKFGMKKEDVESIFEREPDTISQDFLKRIDARWENISVKFDKKKLVNEISFTNGTYRVFYENIDIFNDDNIIKLLNKTEKPLNTVGFKVYFKVGIAFTGFGKNKEEKTVSIFSKELIDLWKN